MAEKQDMIDRKGAWIERMFDRLFSAIQSNPFATLLILSIGLNYMQFADNREMTRLRIEDISSLNEKINTAVYKNLQKELPIQLAPYKEQQDSNSKKLDTSLHNLNGTVESVKEYFNKNKKR